MATATTLQRVAALIATGGWATEMMVNVGEEAPTYLWVWHSNGDDHAEIYADGTTWVGEWLDRDDILTGPFLLDEVIPADSEDAEHIAATVLRQLAQDDPICAGCGAQGHNDGPSCEG